MRSLIFLLCVVGLLSGCGAVDDGLPKTVTAQGVVTCDGKPLEGASIVCMQDGGNYFARAITDSSGRFSLDAYESKRGAVPGTYKVTISKTVTVDKATPTKVSRLLTQDSQHAAEGDPSRANVSWVNDLPDKYNSPITSGLTVTVPDSGVKDLKLEISRN